jgi:HPt (histidine-containing phosphotransfer) domain-containing protein
MPEMDGFELTAALRAAEVGSDRRVPIVALTADALPGTEQRCLAAGMDGYLAKPIDSKLLAAALEKWLPGAAALRRARKADVTKRVSPEANIDPLVFTPARLKESFGDLNNDARAFLAGFLAEAPAMASAVMEALDAEDWAKARHHAHALKGAALSIGAVRLGELAGEVQDYLDQSDPETALLFAGGLELTVVELQQTVAPLTLTA